MRYREVLEMNPKEFLNKYWGQTVEFLDGYTEDVNPYKSTLSGIDPEGRYIDNNNVSWDNCRPIQLPKYKPYDNETFPLDLGWIRHKKWHEGRAGVLITGFGPSGVSLDNSSQITYKGLFENYETLNGDVLGVKE